MARNFRLFHLCLFLLAVAYGLQSNSYAQSIEDLEKQILGSDPDDDEALPLAEDLEEEESAAADESFEVNSVRVNEKASESALERVDELVKGPNQIPFEHILVVQRKYIEKKSKHEITPFSLSVQPADSFRKQIQMGFSYAYHLTDSFAVELAHLMATTNLKTGFSEDLSEKSGLGTIRLEPVLTFGASLQWSPFKGKSASISDIYHFEGYLLVGGAYTLFEEGSSATFMGGGGIRMFVTPEASFKFELRDYYDFHEDSGNRFNILLGASVFFGGES